VIFLLILCAIIAFYFFAKKRNNYWTVRGVKSLNTNFFLGISYDFLIGRSSLEKVHEDVYAAELNEPYVGTHTLLIPQLFIRDPELIHRITVNDFGHFHDRFRALTVGGPLIHSVDTIEGEEWKIVRSKLNPTFSSSKMKAMYDSMNECVEMLIERHVR